MSDVEELAGEHQQWCQAEAHADCCDGHCDCGRDERRDAIAAALAAEREKARAPFLAVADRCNECRGNAASVNRPAVAMAYDDAAEWIRRAAQDQP